jgi:Copper amine oxidase, enzyme domain
MQTSRFPARGLMALVLALASVGPVLAQDCPAPYKITWPDSNPVWSMCWTPPNSSSGVDGSGLELNDVRFKGKRVLYKANIPVLNVLYEPGGCGGSTLSYRDWANQLWPFDANNVISPGYAEPTTPPKTVCDHPGSDAGSFSGVTVEKRADALTLTTQMTAGWYRYIQQWIFFPDGSFSPRFDFTAIENPCIHKIHTHHVYWRLDFDIDGAANNVVEKATGPNPGPTSPWVPLTTETSDKRPSPIRFTRPWRVRNKDSGRGYIIRDNIADGSADSWADADHWVLRYHSNEQDDGGATGGPTGDAIHIHPYLNGENVDGQDVVIWYHAGHQHVTPLTCVPVGPRIVPFGPW